MKNQARVVFSGRCLPGFERAAVALAYSELMGIAESEAEAVLAAGEPVTLEKQVDLASAESFQAVLASKGLEVDVQLLISDEWSPFLEEQEAESTSRSTATELTLSEPEDNSEASRPNYWSERVTTAARPEEIRAQDTRTEPDAGETKPPREPLRNNRPDTATRPSVGAPQEVSPSIWARLRSRWAEVRVIGAAAVGLAMAAFLTSMLLPKPHPSDGIASHVRSQCNGKSRCEAIIGRQLEYCWQTTGMVSQFGDWRKIDAGVVDRFLAGNVNDYLGCFVDNRGMALFHMAADSASDLVSFDRA